MILHNPHLTVSQLASLLDVSIGSVHMLFSTKLGIPHVRHHNKKCLLWSMPISNRAGSQWCGYVNNVITAEKMDLLLQSYLHATDARMDSTRSFLPIKTTCYPKKKKKKKCWLSYFLIRHTWYTHAVPDNQTVNADWYVEVLKQLIKMHVRVSDHFIIMNGQWNSHHNNACPHIGQQVRNF